MAKQKKWNNQGGSKRDYDYSGDYKSTTNIPAFDKKPESNLTSFVFSEKTKQEGADYGDLGDDIWTSWKPEYDLELPEYKESDYSWKKKSSFEVDDNLERSTSTKNIRIKKTTEYNSYVKSKEPDLTPETTYKEYEIVVKFKKLVLTILSGQAYSCRNNLNNALFDFALVIRSSEPISINGGSNATLHTIESVGSKQDPMFVVYNWVLDKLKLVTDNTGKMPDFTLQRLPRRGVTPLPATSFVWNGFEWNLFNGSGLEPTQICLHATNDIVKFRPTSPKNASFLWTVLSAGEPLSLCKSLLPTVSISMAPGGSSSLDPIDGMSFVFRISIDSKQTSDTWIKFEINGDVPTNFYIVHGSNINLNNEPIFIIPANSDYIDVSIEPLVDNTQTADRELTLVIAEDTNTYEIDVDRQTVTVLASKPEITLFGGGNILDYNSTVQFVFVAPIGKALTVYFNVGGTAVRGLNYQFYPIVSQNFIQFSGSDVPTGESQQVKLVTIDIIGSGITSSKTIEIDIVPSTNYTIDNGHALVTIDPIPVSLPTFVLDSIGYNPNWYYIGELSYLGSLGGTITLNIPFDRLVYVEADIQSRDWVEIFDPIGQLIRREPGEVSTQSSRLPFFAGNTSFSSTQLRLHLTTPITVTITGVTEADGTPLTELIDFNFGQKELSIAG